MLVVPLAAVAAIAASAASAPWQAADVARFLALVVCGLAAVEATRSVTSTRDRRMPDQLAVWCLPVAVLLPPFWALIAPIPLLAHTQLRVNRADPQLRVFGAAASVLAYGAASVAFHLSIRAAGITTPGPGIGTHALTWTLLVSGCGILAWAAASSLTYLARADGPGSGRIRLLPRRDVFFADFVQLSLGVTVTVVVAINPVLVIFAVPSILVQRRLLTIHSDLVDRARTDAKTGLLNFRAWETTASSEVTRAVDTRSPLAVAIADIDHFKLINDSYGHLAGDKVLQAVAGALRTTIRPYDLAGRFGGEEFALLFPATGGAEAIRIAERLRRRVAGLKVAASERPGSPPVTITVSVGVATLDTVGGRGEAGLTDLLAAADTALYRAKDEARNKVCLYRGPEALPVPRLEMASAGRYPARA